MFDYVVAIFIFFGISGMIFLIIHGIHVHRFGNFLIKNHPAKWDELAPKSFMGISRDNMESRNYFKEMGFVFSSDSLNDEKVTRFKRKIKFNFWLGIASLLCALLTFLLPFAVAT